ncbi:MULTISPECIES: hypothetical protein [Shewanella]|jgi:hypothetical protein|uniref:Uncharacterized protein n=1 Tax=Shewanella vesiculosa TaxID=518738 RepID=A0ABV0FRY7_9GAMM|nr:MULTISPECIES: hypothetical protein [Shewanella]NCQ43955.1 hypothetical protein [Shewanella frigidimarina]NCO70329.1 hypothetical protein [Shewanella vesiculosa]NCP37163.1 hypothetical protein [Shewanella vesiculosa]NCP68450.1 hypothetical protein [Shewanella vesiculosa]NCP74500.1 hypothetical protein [Shewanella vesiculosa]|tara:strand:- start:215 stop:544 length:330 start_codon:yes stop_codon:yes gene_type:complete
MWWRVTIISLAYLLLGAHFLRFDQHVLAIIAMSLPLLMLIRHSFTHTLLKIGLLVSVVFVWSVSAFNFIDMRIALQQPWLRLAIIMLSVMVFTVFAAFSTNGLNQKLRR